MPYAMQGRFGDLYFAYTPDAERGRSGDIQFPYIPDAQQGRFGDLCFSIYSRCRAGRQEEMVGGDQQAGKTWTGEIGFMYFFITNIFF